MQLLRIIIIVVLTISVFVTILHTSEDCDFTRQLVWKTCGIKNTTLNECENLGCCFAPDDFLLANNLTWKCLTPSNSSKSIQNGTCLEYSGSTCSKYFEKNPNVTSSDVTSKHYIDNAIGLNRTNELFGEFFKALERGTIKNSECLGILSSAICLHGLPACYADGTPRSICREDCEHIMKICGDDTAKLLGAIQYIAIKENIDFSHLVVIDGSCNTFEYSYVLKETANKTCGYLFQDLDRTRPTKIKDNSDNTILYIVAAVGAILFITVIVAILLIRRLKYNKARRKSDHDLIPSMTSIRDRIRRDSFVNPLIELLKNSKPGELVQYPLDCVEYIRDLGEGQFGKVFQGRVHGVVKGEESSDVAVKCLKEGSSSQAVEAFQQEVALMSVLQHENILGLLAVSTEEEPYCMIFEFMENGDLNEYLRKCKANEFPLEDSVLIKMSKHVAAGMEYLASKKFLHRDLATRNCLVGGEMQVKIADFGMSRNVYHSDYYRVGGEAMLPIRWMPPEAVLYGKFTVAADIYSFGVVLWEIFSFALQPFYGYSNEEVIEFIKKGVLLPQPEDCPEWIYNIMLDCWKREPEERVSFTQALKMLKGQFSDYDSPPNRGSTVINDGYDVVKTHATSPTSYDRLPKRVNILKNDGDNTRYKNISINGDKEKPIGTSQKDQEVNPYQNIRPGMALTPDTKADGNINKSFDNEVDIDLQTIVPKTKEEYTTPSSSSPRSQKRGSLEKIESSVERKLIVKARSLGVRKSIKDVLQDESRYVKSKSMMQQVDKTSVDKKSETLDVELQPAFLPSNEFLSYHGYGEDIRSNNPSEQKMIRKLIDANTPRRSSAFQ